VFGDCRLRERGKHFWQRRHNLPVIHALQLGLVICLAGCGSSWQQLYDHANLNLHQGYYEAAIQEAEDGYRKAQTKDVGWSWRFRILKAEGLMRNRLAEEAVSLLREDPPHDLPLDIRARKKLIQGMALCRAGHPTQAEARLVEADQQIPFNSTALKAELIFARGSCAMLEVPEQEQATGYFVQAAKLAHGVNPFLEVSSIGNLGSLALNTHNYDRAIDYFLYSLPMAQETHSALLEEKTLGSLGYAYSQLGDYRRAIDYSNRAVNMAAELGRLDDEGKWLLDLGREYAAMPSTLPGGAEPTYKMALSLAKKLQDKETAKSCFHNLAVLALENGDVSKAESYWTQEAPNGSPANKATAKFDEARIAVAKKDFSKAASIFQDLLKNENETLVLRAIFEQHLGSVYWAQNKIPQADHMFLKGIRSAEEALDEVGEDHRVSVMDEHPFYDSYIRFLVAQHKAVQALEISERGRTVTEISNAGGNKKLGIRPIRAQLKKTRRIILDYQLTNEESLLWVITPTQFQVFHLPRHVELYTQIEAYNKEIQDRRDTSDSAAAQKLFTTLIQPGAKLIPKDSSVTIIPSKVLYGLNFETLVVPGAHPHYWIDDVEIQTASSLRAINKPRHVHPKPAKDLLQVGAPVEASKEFPVLKYAGEEMEKITQRFASRAQTIAGKDATPQAYLSSNPQDYRMIQFVTHGTASETVPLESAIILSEQADRSYKLYARDIVKRPLRADLVTISACYGAGTRWYQSEGLVGLAWAFLHAGAHQVVAGLWEVDDAATPQFMDHFYEGLQQGKSAAAALRSAKLKMLHSGTVYKHPFYWASLQLYTGR